MTRSRLLAYAALLGNTFLWALAIPVAKAGFEHGLTPTTFLLGRYIVATALSLPIILALTQVSRKQVRTVLATPRLLKIIALELLGTFFALWLLYEGVARTGAIESSLIAITWPIFVTIGGVLFLKEKEERHEALGLSLAILGTLLLILEPLLNHGLSGTFQGNILILAQNVSIAIYYLLAKKNYQGLNKWVVTHVSFWVGIAAFGAVTLVKGLSPLQELTALIANPSPWPLIAVIYMGLFGSIIALTLYLVGQDKIEASEAAVFTYLQPLFAIPASMLLLRETITRTEIIAALTIAAGVYLTEYRPRRKSKRTMTSV